MLKYLLKIQVSFLPFLTSVIVSLGFPEFLLHKLHRVVSIPGELIVFLIPTAVFTCSQSIRTTNF